MFNSISIYGKTTSEVEYTEKEGRKIAIFFVFIHALGKKNNFD